MGSFLPSVAFSYSFLAFCLLLVSLYKPLRNWWRSCISIYEINKLQLFAQSLISSKQIVLLHCRVGVRGAKDAGAKVVAVPSLQGQDENYSIANCLLHTLLEFQPELWGLPAFEDGTFSYLLSRFIFLV